MLPSLLVDAFTCQHLILINIKRLSTLNCKNISFNIYLSCCLMKYSCMNYFTSPIAFLVTNP